MSSRRAIASPGIVIAVLILQVIPLLIFPPDSFSPKTQEWWKITDPMQTPLPNRAPGEWWMSLQEVFHTD